MGLSLRKVLPSSNVTVRTTPNGFVVKILAEQEWLGMLVNSLWTLRLLPR